jgi:hypothetical protein
VLAREAQGRLTLTDVSRRLLPEAPDALPLSLVSGWAGHDVVFEAWAGLEHTLRTGECGLTRAGGMGFEQRLAATPQASALYQTAMSSTAGGFEACAAVLGRLSFGRVVDIGGGRGDLLRAVLDRAPHARGLCIDLPHVVNALPPTCDSRLEYLAGDALEYVPPGADLYLTSTVLRCMNDQQVLRLLGRVRAAMTRRPARLMCFELLRPEVPDALTSMQDLTAWVVYGGHDRSASEFESLFAAAGLRWAGAEPVQGNLHALHAVRRSRDGPPRRRLGQRAPCRQDSRRTCRASG